MRKFHFFIVELWAGPSSKFLDNFIVFPLGLSRIPRVIDELFEEEKKQEKRTLDLYINGFFSMMMNVPTPIICRMFFWFFKYVFMISKDMCTGNCI